MNGAVSIAWGRKARFRLKNKYLRSSLWGALGLCASLTSWHASLETATSIALLVFALTLARNVALGGFVSGPTLLTLFIGLFHLGLVAPIVLFGALEPLTHIRRILHDPLLTPAVSLVTLGLAMFSAGLEFANRRTAPPLRPTDRKIARQPTIIHKLWCLLVFVFGSLYLFFGLTQGILFEERAAYLELKSSGESQIFGIARQLMIMSTFVAVAFAPKRRAISMAIALLVLILPMLLAGKRGEFLVTAAALGVVFSLKGIRIPASFVVASIIAVLAAIPILRRIRGGVDAYALWYLDPFYEMGTAIRNVAYTIDAIQTGVTGWWYGSSYLNALWRVVPNVGDIRGTLIGGAASESPGTWLTEVYNPGGAGLGYSNIAEPYLNFGMPGVAAVLFIIGYTLAKLERKAQTSSYVLAVYGALLSTVLWTARNDFFGVFRPLVWVMVGLLLTRVIVEAGYRK